MSTFMMLVLEDEARLRTTAANEWRKYVESL